MTTRPVREGEEVRFGDVFAWVNVQTGEQVQLLMFVSKGRGDWTGVNLMKLRRGGDVVRIVEDGWFPLVRDEGTWRWERIE